MTRIVSIDIETTGLDEKTCQVVEFGAVIETVGCDTPVEDLPTFHCYVVHRVYQGEPFALGMHAKIFKRVAAREKGFCYLEPERLGFEFRNWLLDRGYELEDTKVKVQCAGKNFANFDMRFLRLVPEFTDYVGVAHRTFDPGTLYFNPRTDDKIPDTAECLRRAGLDCTVSHTAVGDAQNVVRLLRHKWQH